MPNDQFIWDFLKKEGFTDCGVAGLMGNLNAESGLSPTKLQNTYNSKLGLSDEEYTRRVDNGTYTNFVNDGAGYGLAQWTYYSRKQNLLNFAKSKGKSIGDLEIQLQFLLIELTNNYTNSVYKVLKTATSVQQASDAVLLNFERPANAQAQKIKRAQFGQNYYNKFAKKEGNINMATNTYQKGQRVKLSAHFNSSEFDCHGSGCCSSTLINPDLVKYLQKIREHFNAPITITSAYRCVTHNRRIGGATGSRHTKGDAADIVVKGVSPRTVAQYAESIGIKGIGLYETSADGFFTHIDTRPTKSFWYGQACQPRTTFGGSTSQGGSSTITPPVNNSSIEISLNDSGSMVKEIQQMLISLGYILTANPADNETKGADGIFGIRTYSAVRDFQKKNNLTVDGIVGAKTLEALEKATSKSSYRGRVTASLLNVRADAGISNPVVGALRRGTECVITQEKDGWGKINCPIGWVSLDYIEKI